MKNVSKEQAKIVYGKNKREEGGSARRTVRRCTAKWHRCSEHINSESLLPPASWSSRTVTHPTVVTRVCSKVWVSIIQRFLFLTTITCKTSMFWTGCCSWEVMLFCKGSIKHCREVITLQEEVGRVEPFHKKKSVLPDVSRMDEFSDQRETSGFVRCSLWLLSQQKNVSKMWYHGISGSLGLISDHSNVFKGAKVSWHYYGFRWSSSFKNFFFFF